jgi:hypothetical protein
LITHHWFHPHASLQLGDFLFANHSAFHRHLLAVAGPLSAVRCPLSGGVFVDVLVWCMYLGPSEITLR